MRSILRTARAVGVCLLAATAALAAVPASGDAAGTAAVAWGSNGHGELGAGYTTDGVEHAPVSVIGVSDITAVLAAGQTSYALLSNGTVKSWGANLKKELGEGETELFGAKTATPIAVFELTPGGETRELTGVTAIAAKYGDDTHAMALVNDSEHEGEVFTWGASEYGQRGNGEHGFEPKAKESEPEIAKPRNVAIPVPGLKHVIAIAAAANTDYALREVAGKTTVWAWGENHGRLGDGELTGPEECDGEDHLQPCATTPQEVELPALPEGVKVTSIAAGKVAAYAILSNGDVLSWGTNDFGQLGDGAHTDSAVPVYVCAVGAKAPCGSGSYLSGITAIAGGEAFALALNEEGDVFGWGNNGQAELGGSSSEECGKSAKECQMVPKRVEGLEHVSEVSAGGNYSLALSEGDVYAWGNAEEGELGIGTVEGAEACHEEKSCFRTPQLVKGLSSVGGISAGMAELGEGHSIAYLLSGSGPPPLITLVPKKEALEVVWRVTGEEFHISWHPVSESESESESHVKLTDTCSEEHPCSYEIKGLKAEPYEVDVRQQVGAALKAKRISIGTPEA
jgi:hypothetical protein